ncbi:MAG: class I SAM-dependent methyltransferase [bacterium]
MEQSIQEFYNNLASSYDEMTGFEQRFIKERPFFRLFVERYRIQKALDLGCGTGFHTLLLAQLGVIMTGVDVSEEMIAIAEKHSKNLGLKATFIHSTLQHVNGVVRKQFDAVFILGNTLPHLHPAQELVEVLHSLRNLIKPGGMVMIQNLNYDRILKERKAIQAIKQQGEKTFKRSYKYRGDSILFKVSIHDKLHDVPRESESTLTLYPLLERDLRNVLDQAGFCEIESYGSIAFEAYEQYSSKDLVVIAKNGIEKY